MWTQRKLQSTSKHRNHTEAISETMHLGGALAMAIRFLAQAHAAIALHTSAVVRVA